MLRTTLVSQAESVKSEVVVVCGPALELGMQAGPWSPLEDFWAGTEGQDWASVVTRDELGEASGSGTREPFVLIPSCSTPE